MGTMTSKQEDSRTKIERVMEIMLIHVWQCRSFHTSSFQKVDFVPQNLVPDLGPSMVTKY